MKQTLLALCCAVVSFSALAKTELTVYTIIEPELLNIYKTEFEKANPDIEINWIRDSTGVITAKLLAEKENPKADVAFGVAASSLLIFDKEGMLLPYKPKGYDLLSSQMKDDNTPPHWVGTNAWATSLCINKFVMKKHNLPYPKTWQDLTNPIYKGLIAAPNPASSGSGFMNISAWIQMWGKDKAWAYQDALNENIKMYTHSGSKPCSMAAQGEVAIGLSSSSFAHSLIKRRAPIDLVIPEGGIGWDMEAAAIIKGTKHLEAAKKLVDWVSSDDVAKIGAVFSGIPSRAEFITPEGKISYNAMIKNNFKWAANNRSKLIQQWRDKYELN
ncbi:putative 2-aminoethylphosphonate ABC transporter substrate-binding protein [Photobacterium phosphoreum]|uniref:putative 2-aminoethylphosphonate ABC transporter substrate-binding protein n=1 Tax=Photobacterium phosphoreum TaxID=659 RepID=UPI000D15CB5F|nr:putative 2-aminoethylphosphonate ABC transporter substrate-binding protein [Photobacterium phosphoreum]PSU64873.1 putative 2-aminoethylphosphonate ABC transporter substrate-binding protein [Photobacterium phosphoreum]PSW06401.1 putative 2-aminoethylphosphonate ABC transporter substrate-binding protein [Photobacterium phosphoreum]